MATLTNLSGEERIGLGIAAIAHAALVVALVWKVSDKPTELPEPERIEVSLADDVSLTSTAPEPAVAPQADIAPVLAPVPAPMVEPVPAPPVVEPVVPVVVRNAAKAVTQPLRPPPPAKVAARSTPKPPAKATPQPARPPAGGTRLGSDFLSGVSAGERTAVTGTPAATFGPAESALLQQAINRQLKPHWSAPQGADAELLVTVLSWELNSEGGLAGAPQVVSQSGITDSNRPQAKLHAERAIRAVQLAAPFDLPAKFYDRWKRVRSWRFDRKL